MAGITKEIRRAINWVDHHARLGWYIALIVTLNLIIDTFK